MKNRILATALSILASLGVAQVNAAETTVKVGDPAPKLQVSKWAQGEPVAAFEKGKVYIVEFWATWCGPCVATIPHLNELHQKFKDKGVIVIGQNVWEDDETKVDPFIKRMGDKMTYRVALDDKSADKKGFMAKNWMEAAGQNGIPAAFVVNKEGIIVWIGHPASLKDKLLEDVLADRFDLKKAAAAAELENANRARLNELGRKLSADLRSKNWDEADATIGELEKILPESQRGALNMVRFQVLVGRGDYAAAYKFANKISDENPSDARLQAELALNVSGRVDPDKRDHALAEKFAERANKATEGKVAGVLEILARAQFMNGKKDEALATMEKAVAVAEDEEQKTELQKTLAGYRQNKLPEQGDF